MRRFQKTKPRLVAELHALSLRHPHLAFGTPLSVGEGMGERVRNLANLPVRRSVQCEGGRGLGYGG
jgi:hypothetical protein